MKSAKKHSYAHDEILLDDAGNIVSEPAGDFKKPTNATMFYLTELPELRKSYRVVEIHRDVYRIIGRNNYCLYAAPHGWLYCGDGGQAEKFFCANGLMDKIKEFLG